MSDRLGPALAFAAAGLCVIPCKPKDKRPALPAWERWQHKRPSEAQIRLWFGAGDDNIAIICGAISGGLTVLDFDREAAFEHWSAEHPDIARAAPIVRTARGRHVYLKTSNCAKSGRPAPGIDVKGEGGYVIAPPSIHPSGTPYELLHGDFAAIPTAELAELGLDPAEVQAVGSQPQSLDGRHAPSTRYAQAALDAELRDLRSTPNGQRNERLNRAAFALGQLVAAGALDRATVESELEAAAASIGLRLVETRATVRSGIEAGLKQPRQVVETDRAASAPARVVAPPPDLNERSDKMLRLADFLARDDGPQTWLLPDLIPADGLAILAGQPASGKTFLALDLALGLASGGRAWGRPTQAVPVVYVDSDNPQRLLKERLRGLLAGRGIQAPSDLYVISGLPLSFAKVADVNWLSGEIVMAGARLIVFDSLIRFMGGTDENDSQAVSAAMTTLRRMATAYGCAILLLHHLRKSSAIVGATALDNVRGSGDLTAAVDSVMLVKGDDGIGTVTTIKSRWAETPVPFGFAVAADGPALAVTIGEAGERRRKLDRVVAVIVEILAASATQLGRKELIDLLGSRGLDVSDRTADQALAILKTAGRVRSVKAGRVNVYELCSIANVANSTFATPGPL